MGIEILTPVEIVKMRRAGRAAADTLAYARFPSLSRFEFVAASGLMQADWIFTSQSRSSVLGLMPSGTSVLSVQTSMG